MFTKLKIIFSLLLILNSLISQRSDATDSIIEIDNNFKKFKMSDYEKETQNDSEIIEKIEVQESKLQVPEKEFFERIKKEPSYTEVLNASLRFYAIPSASDFRSYRKRARIRNLLPEVNGGIDYIKDRDWGYETNSVNPNNGALWGGSGNVTYNHTDLNSDRIYSRGLSFGVSSRWNLNDFLYDDELTDILSEQRRFATIKNDLIEQTHSIYYERRRKQITFGINPAKDEIEKIMFQSELDELTAKIDSLTGGWFSKELNKRQNSQIVSIDAVL
ncbi:MAG: hypothetical protein QNJ31_07450 [Candidatus Caenarcaniphilales bacterium]|nr:hypothetical protein [Candidatus Caenarcaniphilales bacterium]